MRSSQDRTADQSNMLTEDKVLLDAWKSRQAKNAVLTKVVRSRRAAARNVQAKLIAAKGPARSLASGPEDPHHSITRMNNTIRMFHQHALKKKGNLDVSLHNLENNRATRLSEEDIRTREKELPTMIKGIEDLRDLWRGLVREFVQPLDEMHIKLFIACMCRTAPSGRWTRLIGNEERWKRYFALQMNFSHISRFSNAFGFFLSL
ncbi:hypothetical protein M3Y99_01738300 [Aphelenchoides fujianensis]|nr:hypothetical protein M3Y99_01738300 [Aphelenchoides fujianensis]